MTNPRAPYKHVGYHNRHKSLSSRSWHQGTWGGHRPPPSADRVMTLRSLFGSEPRHTAVRRLLESLPQRPVLCLSCHRPGGTLRRAAGGGYICKSCLERGYSDSKRVGPYAALPQVREVVPDVGEQPLPPTEAGAGSPPEHPQAGL